MQKLWQATQPRGTWSNSNYKPVNAPDMLVFYGNY